MKKQLLTVLLCLIVGSLYAQEMANTRRVRIISPEVTKDSITFRFRAEYATTVSLTGSWQNRGESAIAMKRDNNLVWSVTIPTLQPDLYYYTFNVDGTTVCDPANTSIDRDGTSYRSIFLVDGDHSRHYKDASVSGNVSAVWYDSPTIGAKRKMMVYTPAGYDDNKKAKYPVLYLLHGGGGDEEAWLSLGRAAQILDNLIAQGKAEPMLVVMTNGNISQEACPGETSEGFKVPTMMLPKTMEGSFETAFPDVVNFIEKTYRVKKDKAHRAIAGLSMGGFHSLFISINNPDLFGYIGLFSAAVDQQQNGQGGFPNIYADRNTKIDNLFGKKPNLFWIGIGKTDFLIKNNNDLRAYLDSKHHKYTYLETEGGHIWRNWRIYLSEFTPLLFK